LVEHIVEPLGVQVTKSGDASEAVAAAQSESFDMILMDIRMPGIDGPTAAKLIRSGPGRNASTPIIAFTADVAGEMPAAWASVFDGVLAKPLVAADLVLLLASSGQYGQSQPSEATSG
jgi:CheY-like chemotaxis protein